MLTLITVEEALRELNRFWQPPLRTTSLPLIRAAGHVLAEPLSAPFDVPPFTRATMDGYAIHAADSYGASDAAAQFLTLSGQIAMGEAPQTPLARGQAMQIATGGMLPPGADAVMMLEYTELLGDQLLLQRAVAPGENVTQKGEDLTAGETVLPVGHLLTPLDIGLAASLSYTILSCYARPRAAIFSSGDELLQPGEPYRPGMIYDSNGAVLTALCNRLGITADFLGCLPDEQDAMEAAFREALPRYDLLLLSGGTSVGGRDFTQAAIDACGKPGVLVHGLNIKPGKPTLLGLIDDKPVFGLSGNPVTAAITFQLLVEPTLARWPGIAAPRRKRLQARLTRNLPSPGGMVSYVRCRLQHQDDTWLAQPLLGGSGLLSTLALADALLTIPAQAEGLREGSVVEVELLKAIND